MTSPDVHDQPAEPATRAAAPGDASGANAATGVAGALHQPRSHEVRGSLAVVVQAASNIAADSGEEQAYTDTRYLMSRMPAGVAAAMGAAAVVQLAISTARATSAESSAPADPNPRRE